MGSGFDGSSPFDGFDPFDKLRAGRLRAGGLATGWLGAGGGGSGLKNDAVGVAATAGVVFVVVGNFSNAGAGFCAGAGPFEGFDTLTAGRLRAGAGFSGTTGVAAPVGLSAAGCRSK